MLSTAVKPTAKAIAILVNSSLVNLIIGATAYDSYGLVSLYDHAEQEIKQPVIAIHSKQIILGSFNSPLLS